jgi:hypothetical protein
LLGWRQAFKQPIEEVKHADSKRSISQERGPSKGR